MARVLVTGATGFIGRHLSRRLLEHGDQVRCLVRKPDWQDPQNPLPVETALGDVTLPDTLGPALRGIEVVYHLAGATIPTRNRLFRVVNAEGTRHLAEACARQPQPPVMVYASSLAAAGPAFQGLPLTETDSPHPVSEYGRSKLAAEQNLRALADSLPVTVLRPPCVIGPGDRWTLKFFRLARRGIHVVPGGREQRLSWIYVSDLVEALLLAADRGQRLAPPQDHSRQEQGLYYVALDEQPPQAEMACLAAEVQGLRIRRTLRIPTFLCWFSGWFNDLRTRLTGRTFLVNTDKLREGLAGSWLCSADKAKRELGFVCRTDLATGFRLTCRWYAEQGWL